MTTTTMATMSKKLRAWTQKAAEAGLVVEIEHAERYLESWHVEIRLPNIYPVTALDMVENAQSLYLYAVRSPGGRYTHTARQFSWAADMRQVPLSHVTYIIQRYGEQLADRNS